MRQGGRRKLWKWCQTMEAEKLQCQHLIILGDKAGYIEHWIWHLDMFVLFSLKLSHIFSRLRWRMQENLRWRKSLEMVLTTSWIAWCTYPSMPMSWRWGEASIQVHITSALAFQCKCHPSTFNKCKYSSAHNKWNSQLSFPAFQNTAEILRYVKQSFAAVLGAEKNAGKSRKLSSHRVLSSFAGCTSSAVLVPFLSNSIGSTSRRCTVLSAKTCHKVQLNPSAIIRVIPNMAFRERRRHTKIFQICIHGSHPALSKLFIIGTEVSINSPKSPQKNWYSGFEFLNALASLDFKL